MSGQVVRGFTKTLDAYYRDGFGSLADATDPEVSIVNPLGVTVVTATPDHISLGHYRYEYPVAGDAPLGAWEAQWSGEIDGFATLDDDGFTVVASKPLSAGPGNGMTCVPWATSADACSPCDDYELDVDALDQWMQVASDVLFQFTRRRWAGVCYDVIRPSAQYREQVNVGAWWNGGRTSPYGWCSCNRSSDYGCASVPQIKLPGFPVIDDDSLEVLIDGVELDPGAYRVDDHRLLVRTDGDGWPCCQDMTKDATEEGTFQISYPYGAEPPIGGVTAAAALGCQLFLSCQPEELSGGRCRLPQRVTSITRQGTTIAILDPLSLFKEGLTGLPEVDLWVASVNRGDATRRATVIVPGRSRGYRRPSG